MWKTIDFLGKYTRISLNVLRKINSMKTFIYTIALILSSMLLYTNSFSQPSCSFHLDSANLVQEYPWTPADFLDVYAKASVIIPQEYQNYSWVIDLSVTNSSFTEDTTGWTINNEEWSGDTVSFISTIQNLSIYYPGETELAVGAKVTWIDYSDPNNPTLVEKTYSDMVIVQFGGLVTSNTSTIKKPFVAYPNPTTDNLTIDGLRLDVDDEISICDMQGKVVLRSHTSGMEKISISLDELNSGLYVLRTSSGQSIRIEKTG